MVSGRCCIWMTLAVLCCLQPAYANTAPQQLKDAEQLLRKGEANQAIGILTKIIADPPAQEQQLILGEANRMLGYAYLAANRPNDARDAWVQAIGMGRFTTDTLAALLKLDYDAGRLTPAIAALQCLLMLNPNDDNYRLLHIQLLLEAGMPAAAENAATSLLTQRPDSTQALLLLAEAHTDLGKTQAALEAYETAWRITPTPTLARTIAGLGSSLGRNTVALNWFERSLAGRESKLSSSESLQYATLLIATRRYAKAKATLETARSNPDPNVRRIYQLLGHIHHELNDTKAAEEAWHKAIEAGLREPMVLQWLTRRALEDAKSAPAANAAKARLQKLLSLLEETADPDATVTQLAVRGNKLLEQPKAAQTAVQRYIETHGLNQTADRLAAELNRP